MEYCYFAGSKTYVNYYKSEDPYRCPYFIYVGYDEEIPSNSHFYMYSKYRKKRQTAGDDSGDDDDDFGGGDAADDSNAVADTCRDSSDIMDLYNPCTSDTVIGLLTNLMYASIPDRFV